ncbi:hypothetical protein BKA70DRAFT_1219115 [Coprinopsis sp. MPI-PUGE-AT-0042]|nr:hypothetical protein BKA70DRAFT_1219115 [Coprinopsis sp. MPI-PUGE-AT-0042]
MSFVPLLATLDEDRRLDAEGLQSMALSKLEMSINQHLTEIAKNVGGSKWSSVEHSLVNEVAKLMDQYNAVLFKLADSRPAVQDRVESLKYPPFELQTFLGDRPIHPATGASHDNPCRQPSPLAGGRTGRRRFVFERRPPSSREGYEAPNNQEESGRVLDSIIEDVGKEGWHRKQARMVQRVQTLMRESNEIVDYFPIMLLICR